METPDELQAYLGEMIQPGLWGQLLARGSAWSLMRQDGVLPDGAPAFGRTIGADLAEYAFSVLRAALALKETGEGDELCTRAFERAANAFESLVRNGDAASSERGFYRLLAAAGYHLAGYSAIAFSLFSEIEGTLNTTVGEDAVVRLILRDLRGLRRLTRDWLEAEENTDDAITAALEDGEIDADDAIALILNGVLCGSLAHYDFALQTGDGRHYARALAILDRGVRLANHAANVPMWWVIRICRALLSDLWGHSLHQVLPGEPPEGGAELYPRYRDLFIRSLYGRRMAEVELWPSQREAAARSTDLTDDLVVALPTSAGKTRVAELAALMTLSVGKRVLIVTPLRALSAQTERSFRKTFAPLGFKVSSLYGASGVSEGDADALRTRSIVIATPEKLDFALRSDPTLIDDVGLIVLDEGHLIGPSEREIRYEILVQRLLRRGDAADRRIVCLSAILPEGEALDDLTSWIRSDAPGEPVKSIWRPTRQRFGSLTWQGHSARLGFDLEARGPYVARFVEQLPPRGQEKNPYPRNVQDLSVMAGWKFAQQGKRTLVFVTQANWVEGFGKAALNLVRRGYLPSLVEDPAPLARALEVGREWLGPDHCAVKALEIGVAIHHGKLPNPFLRELELLLGEGVIKVIVASPTLSQGLNLNAAVLLAPYLVRSGQPITGEEFANVAGRAGRAFVDVEGLVAHVITENADYKMEQWRQLVASARARKLESGLVQVISAVIEKLTATGVFARADAYEYLANNLTGWRTAGQPAAAAGDDDEEAEDSLPVLVEKLDAMVFGLVEALDADSAELPKLLDESLNGSLWARQIARLDANKADWHRFILRTRAALIWAHTTPETRRGHYAMGVGLDSGLVLDGLAEELAVLIDQADLAAIQADADALGDTLVELASRILVIRPFALDGGLPVGWQAILRQWITGADVALIGADRMKTVEDAFAYKLVWALEAIRTRRVTQGWEPDLVAGGAAAAVETGVPSLMAAMLIRAGLPSRRAAMAAIEAGDAAFFDLDGMKLWLESEEIVALTAQASWPTAETQDLWRRFHADVLGAAAPAWRTTSVRRRLHLQHGQPRPADGEYRLEIDPATNFAWVLTADFRRLARIERWVIDEHPALYRVSFIAGDNLAHVERVGPGSATWEPTA
ncbi:MAG: DEAD/DEAH box helicase [Brevundimonas sp.]|uniref:DEAD/DEAH box helicase n=1 Tax=Brevundimonas sp. TaxID=1871086 RepID=UPI00391A8417